MKKILIGFITLLPLLGCVKTDAVNESISSDLLENFVLAQVDLHNEMVDAGPTAMETFLSTYDENDFVSNDVLYSNAFIKSFRISDAVINRLTKAYEPFADIDPLILREDSKLLLGNLIAQNKVSLAIYPGGFNGPKCNCGDDVFTGVVTSALTVASCLSCFGGALPACPGCAWGAGTAIGAIRRAWDCGCFSSDTSPYQ